MTTQAPNQNHVAASSLALLFVIFLLIACGLGYSILNRFDPRQTPGLSDVKTYAEMVTGAASPESGHVRFRVLVPCVAKPVYWLARGRVGSWDPVMFSLLVADSLFVALTAVLIVILGTRFVCSSTVALVGALFYLVNFAVPNLRLVGLVDAGEGFFLLALLWSLAECRFWPLPLIAALGALTKESFIPLSIVFASVWWLAARREQIHQKYLKRLAVWIAISLVVSFAALACIQRAVSGTFTSPWEFAMSLYRGHDYFSHFAASLADRQLWYIFLWLLPTAIPNLKRVPRSWLFAAGATCLAAFALDAFYGGEPGTIGRALFTITGPILSLSSAMLMVRILG